METKEAIDTARAFLINARLTEAQISRLESMGYFDAPAAMRHHLNRPHGLCEHSVNVTRKLLGFEAFKNRESAYRVGMLHDLVKCYNYVPHQKKDGTITYTFRAAPYPGHGVASVLIAFDLGVQLSPEEAASIVYHMGAYSLDEDDLAEYRSACMRFPRQILLTHMCDNLSSIYETLAEPPRRAAANEDGDGDDPA